MQSRLLHLLVVVCLLLLVSKVLAIVEQVQGIEHKEQQNTIFFVTDSNAQDGEEGAAKKEKKVVYKEGEISGGDAEGASSEHAAPKEEEETPPAEEGTKPVKEGNVYGAEKQKKYGRKEESKGGQVVTPEGEPTEKEGEHAVKEGRHGEEAPAEGEAPAAEGGEHGEASAAPEDAAATEEMPENSDPLQDTRSCSKSELDVLESLAERRKELDRWQQDLIKKEKVMDAAKLQVDTKIAQMETLRGQIEGMLKEYSTKEYAKIKSLVKVYENMNPKDAARIFDTLEMPILMEVVANMKEARLAPILSKMNDATAKEVTSELSKRRRIVPSDYQNARPAP
jgi:flagellar motility protein MotE (MotC chaperone)